MATVIHPMPEKKKNLVSVKIDADVYRMVKAVAAWRGLDISDYLTEVVRPVARKDMAKMGAEASRPDRGDE